MGVFDDIPVRVDGPASGGVRAAWFNVIRDALIAYFGSGSLSETEVDVTNNQSSAADVSGLVFSSASYRSAVVEFELKRKTNTAGTEVVSVGLINLHYRTESSAWAILSVEESGDLHGVTFSVTAAGQVQYTSTNIAGASYVGKLKFRSRTFNA